LFFFSPYFSVQSLFPLGPYFSFSLSGTPSAPPPIQGHPIPPLFPDIRFSRSLSLMGSMALLCVPWFFPPLLSSSFCLRLAPTSLPFLAAYPCVDGEYIPSFFCVSCGFSVCGGCALSFPLLVLSCVFFFRPSTLITLHPKFYPHVLRLLLFCFFLSPCCLGEGLRATCSEFRVMLSFLL